MPYPNSVQELHKDILGTSSECTASIVACLDILESTHRVAVTSSEQLCTLRARFARLTREPAGDLVLRLYAHLARILGIHPRSDISISDLEDHLRIVVERALGKPWQAELYDLTHDIVKESVLELNELARKRLKNIVDTFRKGMIDDIIAAIEAAHWFFSPERNSATDKALAETLGRVDRRNIGRLIRRGELIPRLNLAALAASECVSSEDEDIIGPEGVREIEENLRTLSRTCEAKVEEALHELKNRRHAAVEGLVRAVSNLPASAKIKFLEAIDGEGTVQHLYRAIKRRTLPRGLLAVLGGTPGSWPGLFVAVASTAGVDGLQEDPIFGMVLLAISEKEAGGNGEGEESDRRLILWREGEEGRKELAGRALGLLRLCNVVGGRGDDPERVASEAIDVLARRQMVLDEAKGRADGARGELHRLEGEYNKAGQAARKANSGLMTINEEIVQANTALREDVTTRLGEVAKGQWGEEFKKAAKKAIRRQGGGLLPRIRRLGGSMDKKVGALIQELKNAPSGAVKNAKAASTLKRLHDLEDKRRKANVRASDMDDENRQAQQAMETAGQRVNELDGEVRDLARAYRGLVKA
jgi:hypothetical protein